MINRITSKARKLLYATALIGVASLGLVLPLGHQAKAGTLTVAQSYDPQSLWPNFSTSQEQMNVGNAVVESLLWLDPATDKAEPILATGFEFVDDTTVKLALRKDVSFSNGEPMNADAVIESIRIFRDKAITPAYARDAAKIGSVEKIDDHTVLIRLSQKYPAVPLLLSQIYVVPPKYWAEVGPDGFGRKPIGTGPYKLTEWVRDDRVVMDRNPTFWGKPPVGIDKIIWKPVPDDTARAAGVMTGAYDIAANLPATSLPQLQGRAGVSAISVPSYRIFKIDFSTLDTHPGAQHDLRVRQALNYAIDKKAIRDVLFSGLASPLHGQILRSNQLGFNPEIEDYPFDPAKAKALLAEVGGNVEITFKFPSGRYAQDKEVSEAVAGMLSDVGVKVNMVQLEAGEFLNQLNNRELFQMALRGSAPQDDPDAMLSAYLSDWRYSHIQDPELDVLIKAGSGELDPAKRADIYKKAMKLIYDKAYMIFLYQANDLYGTTNRVKNFTPRGDQRFALYNVTLE
ncbi:Peptide/nickel transport system substrate-binding protein [Hyphomicrobiales bacterium]|nr:Peptide/nickel transport system substrate-binding protein [Hyphomicrobiales bacterium]CAH1695486.1 Peptide/nickel transport system substrate-binding protein [Hyphomicrobiales bacterium]